jgi:5-methylcytosine-specific restriction endonuclease McrA
MANGSSFPTTRADLVVVVDLDALGRGHLYENERCHLQGGGPTSYDNLESLCWRCH